VLVDLDADPTVETPTARDLGLLDELDDNDRGNDDERTYGADDSTARRESSG